MSAFATQGGHKKLLKLNTGKYFGL